MQRPEGIMMPATAALSLCVGSLVWAQSGPGQTPAFRSGIEVVSVDVGVVDRQGQPLHGLGAADFVVTVGGQPRRVVSAEFIDAAAPASDLPPRPDVVPVSTNEGAGLGRLFVFLVDSNTLDSGSVRQVGRAASRLLDQLTFADRSALIVMPVGPNVGFTWAHDRVREALQRVTGRSAFNPGEFASLAEARDIANRDMMALRTVGARECGSIVASGGGLPTNPGAGGQTGSGAGAPPSGGGTPPGGGAGGSGTAPGGGQPPTGGAPSGGGGGGGGGGMGGDRCLRDLQMRAESTWRMAQMTSLASLTALRQMLGALESVHGDKTVVLISGGWPLDEHDQNSLLSTVAREAANARATLFTLFAPGSAFSASQRLISTTATRDQQLHSWPLDTLAAMTGGGSFRVDVNAQGAFERLARELAGFYRLGIEKDPTDLDGKGRRMKVQVARSGVSVRAREIFDVRTYEDRNWAARLAAALDGPIPATGVGLRVTSYVASDPDDRTHVRLVLAGEASRLQPGEATFQVAVRDLEGNKLLAGEQPLGEPAGDGLRFSTTVPLPPGSYVVRVAVIDSAGHVGSVDHRVEARQVSLGRIDATGPMLVRVPHEPQGEARFALDAVRQDERLALEVGLEGDSTQLAGAHVLFEIAASPEGPALVHSVGQMSPPRGGTAIAQGVTDMRVLPPGEYVARAKITAGSEAVGEVRRAFTLTEAPRAIAGAASASPALAGRVAPGTISARAAATVPPFALEQVLAPQILAGFLDRVAARPDAASPGMTELLERARTTGVDGLVISDAQVAEAPVAAFLRGLTLLSQQKLEPAANAFRSAMRASPDFYPAMVYLGACYAAGGKDKEAAGAWRTALIREGDAVALHTLLADAFLRQGRGDLALQTVEGARTRWPEDEGLQRRFVMAALLAGRHAEGLHGLDELIEKRGEDEPSLALALRVLYEAFANGQPVEGVEQDHARMIRLADLYRARGGPSLALVETWVAAASRKQ